MNTSPAGARPSAVIPRHVHDLSTPAVLVDVDALEHNLATMATRLPGALLRPHVKAHKSTALADMQRRHGHNSFTCATVREMIGMAKAGMGDDLLLANEVLDVERLRPLAALQDRAMVTIAVDSDATIDAAARADIRHVLIDVNIGLPRCGCAPSDAGRLAELARSRGLTVRGVMGYEGHLMVANDRAAQRRETLSAMQVLRSAARDVGGAVVSAGGTGNHDVHAEQLHDTGVTEVQAGSYALMDTYYSTLGLPFRQALSILGTVVSTQEKWAVADVGLKSLGMDHGNPSIAGCKVWFCSDEHITFAAEKKDSLASGGPSAAGQVRAAQPKVGSRVRVIPAHVDPTMAMHEHFWLVRGDDVLDRCPIDLRGW
jgi:D-serine deaminase-like pyridoxal phosphate-dependent protein